MKRKKRGKNKEEKKKEERAHENKKTLKKNQQKKIKNSKNPKKNGPFKGHPSFSKRSLSVASNKIITPVHSIHKHFITKEPTNKQFIIFKTCGILFGPLWDITKLHVSYI